MILVTGSTGLVGAHLLYQLIRSGEKVRAIYRSAHKLDHVKQVFSCYTDNYISFFKAIEWVKADILDIPSLDEAFQGVSYVYHCAAFVSFEPDKYHLLRKTNIQGTANVVNLGISHNIKKLCYVSSIATIGSPESTEMLTEESEWNPEANNNVYAITKYGAEMEAWRGSQEGLDVVIVNPSVILGGGIWHYGSGSLFKKAQRGFKRYSSGSVGIVDVEDVVKIMIQLIKSDIKNERYILVSECLSYKTFLEEMAHSVNANTPKKLAPQWLLQIAWRLDWFVHKTTGKRRQLTKHLATTISTKKTYSNSKIKKTLDYKFKPVKKTITEIGALYLKQAE